MKKHGWMLFLLAVLVGLLLVYTVTFAVNYRQAAIVSTFGKAGEPIDGTRPGQAGLQFKLPWPIQRLTRYDRRIFIFDDTHEPVSYTHLRAHETLRYLVCRLLLEKKNTASRSSRWGSSPWGCPRRSPRRSSRA